MDELEVSIPSDRPSGAIRLEGLLRLPDVDEAAPGVILCHPHPSGGGEMGVGLLSVLSRSLQSVGSAVLRFNFGGVAGSGGAFTDGAEEPDDVAGAFDYLKGLTRVDADRAMVVGWSFGAWMALTAVARGLPAAAFVAVAPPLIAYDWQGMAGELALSEARQYYIAGDEDQFCPAGDLRDFAREVSAGDEDRVRLLAGADHFLFGREEEVAALVIDSLGVTS